MRGTMTMKTAQELRPDPGRVIAKHYTPDDQVVGSREPRMARLLRRVLRLDEEATARALDDVLAGFGDRHRDLPSVLLDNYARVAHHLPKGANPSERMRMLIGAYVTHEYSIQAAALFNPSMVPAPDQSGLAAGELRFVMSMRAVGEGHISSIEFRTGVVTADADVRFEEATPYASLGTRRSAVYNKRLFVNKLAELGADRDIVSSILGSFPRHFELEALESRLGALDHTGDVPATEYKTVELIRWLALSNYVVEFDPDLPVSERVIFPVGPSESRGMEDARFVRFTADDGSINYYATYTAFDGSSILPQLIETRDFVSFRVATLNGRSAQNKGMALFPRKIGGQYVALSRYDRENIDIMFSRGVRFWHGREQLRTPVWPWELLQIGNCGSPLETEAGWLVLTHGVGPMRTYSIGAVLLDLDDPCRVIADLPEPILYPDEQERDGYVPNVLYSCGGMIHGGRLILPYGFSDAGIRIATLPLDELLDEILRHPSREERRPATAALG